jgi:hypothetical protein
MARQPPTEGEIHVEHDEKKANDEQQTERDEMDDLDVSQQKAEDVKGGARVRRRPTQDQ